MNTREEFMNKVLSRPTVYLLGVVAIIGAFFLGWFGRFEYTRTHGQNSSESVPQRLSGYKHISPLIACDVSSDIQYNKFQPFKNEITTTINSHINAGDVEKVGVYFRELNSGHWVGINENELFWPASLMKVPTMISVLKNVELDPAVLQAKILYKNSRDENDTERIKASQRAVSGNLYSVEDLLALMIRFSDNNSVFALSRVFTKEQLIDVFTDTGVAFPTGDNQDADYMSPKTYSYFFRLLFNASYINRSLSEYALSLLTQTEYKQGLAAGVPSTIEVAHKFGEQDRGSDKQLHDCGIVYYPNHPYLLCVMTKGKTYDRMAETIKSISQTVYTESREFFQ